MTGKRWEHFPHEADMGVRGIGNSKEEAFEQVAIAMFAVITDPAKISGKGLAVYCNAQMGVKQAKKFCALDQEGKNLVRSAIEKLGLSARAYDRILKVARTIADLDNSEKINSSHLAEAIQYRSLDRIRN